MRELFKPGVLEAMIEDENNFMVPGGTRFYGVEVAETVLRPTLPA